MKATGIIRRIDDLGRVVVPKELRKSLRIREGDPVEIFTNREGEIILKKYSQLGEISEFASAYAEAIGQTLSTAVLITDREQVIAVYGVPKKEWLGKYISAELRELMEERGTVIAGTQNTGASQPGAGVRSQLLPLTDTASDITAEAVGTIISEGDVIGAVALFSKEEGRIFGEPEQKVVAAAAVFLGKRLE